MREIFMQQTYGFECIASKLISGAVRVDRQGSVVLAGGRLVSEDEAGCGRTGLPQNVSVFSYFAV